MKFAAILILMALLSSCGFSLKKVTTGVSFGRSFEGQAFRSDAKNNWNVNVNGEWGP